MNFSPRPCTDTNIYVARAASFISPSSLRQRIARFYRRYVELFSGNLVNAGHARLALRVHYRPIPSICQRLENALNCFLPPSHSIAASVRGGGGGHRHNSSNTENFQGRSHEKAKRKRGKREAARRRPPIQGGPAMRLTRCKNFMVVLPPKWAPINHT